MPKRSRTIKRAKNEKTKPSKISIRLCRIAPQLFNNAPHYLDFQAKLPQCIETVVLDLQRW